MEKECGGDTLGEPMLERGAEREIGFDGGGIMCPIEAPWWSMRPGTADEEAPCCLLPRLEFGLLCRRGCLVSSSERLKRFERAGKVQACGFSPV